MFEQTLQPPMSPTRRGCSYVLLVAGSFWSGLTILILAHTERWPGWLLAFLFIFALPSVILVVCGLSWGAFPNWKRTLALTLGGAAAYVLFMAFIMVCAVLSPEWRRIEHSDSIEKFTNLGLPAALLLLLIAAATVLWCSSRQRDT